MTAITVTRTSRTYDGHVYVEAEPVRLSYQPTAYPAKEMFLYAVLDCPDYGPGLVMLVGSPVKKDGTPAARTVKPLIHLSKLPQVLQDAIVTSRKTI